MPERVELALVGPDDWRQWRDLRLAALLDASDAFDSTYAGEHGRDEQQWRERITVPGVKFIASTSDGAAGIVGGYYAAPGVVEVISMWVVPHQRGRGVGAALVEGLLDWARREDAHAVELWVTVGNSAAERLYARHGFVSTGLVEPLPHRPEVEVSTMRLELVRPGTR